MALRFILPVPSTQGELNFESTKFKSNLNSNYTFPIVLAPNGIPFNAKSIRTVELQFKFGLVTLSGETSSWRVEVG